MQLTKHNEVPICRNCYQLKGSCKCRKGYIYVDVGILFVIQTLNIKGYYTTCSCEGHDKEELKDLKFDGVIGFDKEYDFNVDIPNICKLEYYNNTMWLTLKEDCNATKEDFLREINKWCIKLRSIN
jgi:hypothetical protein